MQYTPQGLRGIPSLVVCSVHYTHKDDAPKHTPTHPTTHTHTHMRVRGLSLFVFSSLSNCLSRCDHHHGLDHQHVEFLSWQPWLAFHGSDCPRGYHSSESEHLPHNPLPFLQSPAISNRPTIEVRGGLLGFGVGNPRVILGSQGRHAYAEKTWTAMGRQCH